MKKNKGWIEIKMKKEFIFYWKQWNMHKRLNFINPWNWTGLMSKKNKRHFQLKAIKRKQQKCWQDKKFGNDMFILGFEPGTLAVLKLCDNHYTIRTRWFLRCAPGQNYVFIKEEKTTKSKESQLFIISNSYWANNYLAKKIGKIRNITILQLQKGERLNSWMHMNRR